MRNIEIIANEIGCTGCGACITQCPLNLISLKKGAFGFFVATLSDRSKCIECKKCLKLCPRIHLSFHNEPVGFYYGWRKQGREISTSGGIATAISEYVISKGGSVIGSRLNIEKRELKHIPVHKKSELDFIAKSKYMQSDTSRVFSYIDILLKKNLLTVFIGTPCQVYGLRKKYGNRENLILIDFVCHGVPSTELFFDYLAHLGGKKTSIVSYDFRSKKRGWNHGTIEYRKSNNKSKVYPAILDEYMYCFYKNLSLAKSCYECPFREHHFSDVTIGDLWNYNDFRNEITNEDIKQGISSIITWTPVGEKIIKECEASIFCVKKTGKSFTYMLSAISFSDELKKTRDEFYNTYARNGYSGIKKKYFSFLPARCFKEIFRK